MFTILTIFNNKMSRGSFIIIILAGQKQSTIKILIYYEWVKIRFQINFIRIGRIQA